MHYLSEDEVNALSNSYGKDEVIRKAEKVICRNLLDELIRSSTGGVVTVMQILNLRDELK